MDIDGKPGHECQFQDVVHSMTTPEFVVRIATSCGWSFLWVELPVGGASYHYEA